MWVRATAVPGIRIFAALRVATICSPPPSSRSALDLVDGACKNGRPIEAPGARYTTNAIKIWPGAREAHNWYPMAYSPVTGLVYIPDNEEFGRGTHGRARVPQTPLSIQLFVETCLTWQLQWRPIFTPR